MAFTEAEEGVLRAPNLERIHWLEHGFGTRHTLHWPPPDRLATVKQIHSSRVISANGDPGPQGEGDALITNRPGLMIGVKTADCVPVLLVDTRNRAVAAVHAGWKGTAKSIVIAALNEMSANFGTQAADIAAAIGPSIGVCCYEVGPEVLVQFRQWLPELNSDVPGKLDLERVNTMQMLEAGVPPDEIAACGICTYCGENLHSFRRDRDQAGRMMSAIGVRQSS
jgi:polyphenol oxidase